jgi:hypothetical protein
MKIFISWSGEISHKVALALRDWLPSVIQSVIPYVSSEDIDKGTRWSTDISKELAESSYGILCVTRDNVSAPWLNFEAGALSKAFDKSKVSPFLFGVKRAEVKGPILQFQSTIYEKEDVRKLVHSINASESHTTLDELRLNSIFEVWWNQLKEKLEPLDKNTKAEVDSDTDNLNSSKSEILEEILELVRSQQKIISNPEQVLPPNYIGYVLRENNLYPQTISQSAIRELEITFSLMDNHLSQDDEKVEIDVLRELLVRMNRPIRYILETRRPSRRLSKSDNPFELKE